MAQPDPSPRRRPFRSLNLRIALLVTLFALLTALPLAFLAGQRLQTQALDALRVLQHELTTMAAKEIEQPMKLGFSGTVENQIQHVIERAASSFAYAKAMKSDGVVMAEAGRLPQDRAAALTDAALQVIETGSPWRSADGYTLIYPVLSKKGSLRGALIMSWDPAPVLAAVNAGLRRDAALGALILAAAMASCLLILKRLLGWPMQELAAALERITGGDYSTALQAASRQDELGRIARRIAMLQDTLAEGRAAAEAREADRKAQAKAVDQLRAGLGALARRDLSCRMDQPLAGTYEPLRRDFNSAVSSLAGLLAQVLGTASAVLARSERIEAGSDGLSRRISSQSQELESLSRALSTLTVSLSSAADGVREVNGLASGAVQEAGASGSVVKNAVAAMTGIEQSAGRIETITGVIDDIAFQTNLLALNAGVEAARAGEAGKGFAVVASEVRALAQRSSHAATEIKELITSATRHIQKGVSEVNNTGEVLTRIIARIDGISARVATSAERFTRDSQALEGLSRNLSSLGATTRDNTGIVAQTVQSVGELRGDAGELRTLAAAFQLPESGADTPPQAPPRAA
ncbi:methyl-accepting chemotaxis protein [Leisingera daeponensis]|uniref:Methyl-accepting chemotaxis protein n=1 Tax=Leisingera daeponensis TaxID=405746 RepID=A0ABS7NC77_9RHOB|nr:methyl-accepting chemotaxis protein [Leisingera daeponensis]MBY6138461.1 methyl-accepting chemotaxis protein [Leisingera daeponensis]